MTWLPSRARRLRRLGACLLTTSLLAPAVLAQGGEDAEQAPEPEERAFPALSSRFGLERLVSGLSAPGLDERLAAMQRLAGLGTRAARHRLVNGALERRAQLDAREWLCLVRALAAYAHEDEPRVLLALAMNLRASEAAEPRQTALSELVRGSAALALAASGAEPALRVLAAALRSGGPAAALAAKALLQHPPADLSAFLALPGEPSVELARWLGELGDQRAFHTLRGWVRGESAEVRAAAAIALTQLGALETVPLARAWLRSGVPVLERAALEIGLLTQQPEAAVQLREQLRAAPDEALALSRALAFPSRELLPWAAELSAAGDGAGRRWTLLGRIGGPAAAAQLEDALGSAGSALAAAHALSRMAGNEGRLALERALAGKRALPLVVRAAVLRQQRFGEELAGLPERLTELSASPLPAERAAGAWARSLGGVSAALSELGSRDPVRMAAAANNALCFDDRVLAAAAEQLSRAAPGHARDVFAFALLRSAGAQAISSELLQELVLEAGVAAPLALRVLAARGEPHFQALADTYVEHPDPVLRAHVARGLGESPRAAAVGLLLRSFELETDESVRGAIVRALSLRRGAAVHEALGLAARLDPSAVVRGAAQLALSGVELRDPAPGHEALWAQLLSPASPTSEQSAAREQPLAAAGATSATATPAQPGEVGILHVLPGLALPVFADPAGVLVVAGAGIEPLALRWQSSPER